MLFLILSINITKHLMKWISKWLNNPYAHPRKVTTMGTNDLRRFVIHQNPRGPYPKLGFTGFSELRNFEMAKQSNECGKDAAFKEEFFRCPTIRYLEENNWKNLSGFGE